MINPPQLSFPPFPPYAYFPSTNYLSKPMPLMGTAANPCTQTGAPLPPSAYILPTDLTNSAFFRNQPISSQSPTSPVRTNNNDNNNDNIQNQNGTINKTSNEVNTDMSNCATPIRSKTR